jgi:hypothetical protein
LLGATPLSVTPHPALAIAGKSTIPGSLSSVPFRVVRRRKSHLVLHVLDVNSRLDSIRRSSSFKTHLKKHGLDPSAYLKFSTPDHSPAEVWRSPQPEGIMEGQVSTPSSSYNQEISLSIPEPDLFWDSNPLLSLPVDPCKSITFVSPVLTSCNNVFPLPS